MKGEVVKRDLNCKSWKSSSKTLLLLEQEAKFLSIMFAILDDWQAVMPKLNRTYLKLRFHKQILRDKTPKYKAFDDVCSDIRTSLAKTGGMPTKRITNKTCIATNTEKAM